MKSTDELGFYVDRHLFIQYSEMQSIITAYIKSRHINGDLLLDICADFNRMIDNGVTEEINEDEKERSADNL